MKKIVDVYTGEVKAGKEDMLLKSNAIGSCIVIAAYDSIQKVGALAHIMLPGVAPLGKHLQPTRYASNAIEEMIKQMTHLGANIKRTETCLVGGGNVL